VKEISPTKALKKKTPLTSHFLSLIILILSIVIIFLSYSLIIKFSSGGKKEVFETNKPAKIIQMEVLNGCGSAGIADKFTEYLRGNHFDVVQTGNYISFDISNTMVIDRTGNKANAEKVAEFLGIDKSNIVMQKNTDYFLDVSLVIGKDYIKLKPFN
jgi:hypothetical protein